MSPSRGAEGAPKEVRELCSTPSLIGGDDLHTHMASYQRASLLTDRFQEGIKFGLAGAIPDGITDTFILGPAVQPEIQVDFLPF